MTGCGVRHRLMCFFVGAGVPDSPAVLLKTIVKIWANTYKKRAYSPMIVLDMVCSARDVEDAVPYEVGVRNGGRFVKRPYG